jgi:biotin carboxylase
MILGAGIMQIPAIDTARDNGWVSIVVDGDASALAADRGDRFEHIDLRDYHRIAERARAYRDAGELDGVFTAGTDFSPSVAYVAEQLGLPGIPFETARDARDKVRMRRRFHEAGVPAPGFVFFEHDDVERNDDVRLQEAVQGLRFPLVVKPADNMGARGVARVEEPEGVPDAVRAALQYSGSRRVVVEEFVEGPEFSVDAVVHRGEVTVCGVADRHIAFPPYFVEMGHTLPTEIDSATRAELERVFRKGIAALGVTDGAAKGDILLSQDGPVVGEIAARLSGGYMSGWTFPYATGIPVTEAAMRVALGMDPGSLAPRWEGVSAERAFISIPGTVRSVHGLDAARSIPGVRELFVRAEAGDRVHFPRNNVEKCGNVIALGSRREDAVAGAEAAVRELLVELEPGDAGTLSFLFEDETHAPDAFVLETERARADFAAAAVRSNPKPAAQVRPLSGMEDESGRDWAYRSLTETMERLQRLRGLELAEHSAEDAWGAELWQAVLRGGLQGALALVDSADAAPELVKEYVRRWAACSGRTLR